MRECIYCGCPPSVLGGLIPDGPGKYCCKDDDGCLRRCERRRVREVAAVCVRCGTVPVRKTGLRLLDDASGYICRHYDACDNRVETNRALLSAS